MPSSTTTHVRQARVLLCITLADRLPRFVGPEALRHAHTSLGKGLASVAEKGKRQLPVSVNIIQGLNDYLKSSPALPENVKKLEQEVRISSRVDGICVYGGVSLSSEGGEIYTLRPRSSSY